jgi:exosortase
VTTKNRSPEQTSKPGSGLKNVFSPALKQFSVPRLLGCLGVILLIHAPFLIGWGKWMSGREHYQFFPLILVGFVSLVWHKIRLLQWPEGPIFSVRCGIYLLASWVLYFLVVRTNSHWIGLISCLMALWTTVWFFGGTSVADELRGPFVFLILLVPLPLNMDLQCIVGLQKVATWLASGVLDLMELRHTVSGVALRTAQKAFMVEEACSGIHSLFSAVSAMIFFGVYCRYGVPRLVLTLLQVVFWVVAANAFRVFILVYADSRYQVALDTGWRHETLSLVTYALVLVFSLSTDQLLRFLFPISQGAVLSAQEELTEVLFKPPREFLANFLDKPVLKGKLVLLVPATLAMLMYVPLAGMVLAGQLRHSSAVPSAYDMQSVGAMSTLSGDTLPASIAGWTRGKFQAIQRDPADSFGMTSSIWEFSGHGMTVSVSVDGMYSEFHDLAFCYIGSGWKLFAGDNGLIETNQVVLPHTRLILYKNSGEYAAVYFTCFDSQRTAVNPPEASGNLLRALKNRLVSGGLIGTQKAPIVPPVFQVQLMATSGQELLPHEIHVLEELFGNVRAQILTQLSAGP